MDITVKGGIRSGKFFLEMLLDKDEKPLSLIDDFSDLNFKLTGTIPKDDDLGIFTHDLKTRLIYGEKIIDVVFKDGLDLRSTPISDLPAILQGRIDAVDEAIKNIDYEETATATLVISSVAISAINQKSLI